MNVGSLFSGIGGIELGFEREGFKTKWFVEKDLFCQAVLKKHWKDIPIYGDISTIDFSSLERVDVLTGGFPCQDISIAGKGKGIVDGKRSSLWKHFAKAIGEIRPKFAVIENVSALTFRGLSNVLADLAKERYDAEWFDLRASDFGAPHKRERIFIVAYSNKHGNNTKEQRIFNKTASLEKQNRPQDNSTRKFNRTVNGKRSKGFKKGLFITDDWSKRIQGFTKESFQGEQGFSWCKDVRRIEDFKGIPDLPEPLIRGKNNGISNRLERTKSLGNAVVPQVAQFIARRIKEVKNA